jgi:hypothetical protein
MILKDYFSYDDKESILAQLQDIQAEWGAISFLLSLLKDGTFHEKLGKGSLYLLLDDENLTGRKSTLASFASFCDKDEIKTELKPWIGFVFTSPSYRGRHLAFRDYLRTHPLAVEEYSRIKLEAAKLFPHDIDGYINHKSPVIEKIYKEIGIDKK